jgi:hypothetical protein
MTLIQTFVQQAIQEHPADAAREVPQIIGHYIADNTRLNKVYRAAKAVTIRADKFTLEQLRRAIAEAECGLS